MTNNKIFTEEQLRVLPEIISAPRFATYLRATKNVRSDALILYQWNLEISSAFIVPLQICEVSMRNGAVHAIEKVHGANWPRAIGFQRSLPEPRISWHYNAKKDLRNTADRHPTTGKIVADLKFAFWEKVFTRGQDERLWKDHFFESFPNADRNISIPQLRAQAFDDLELIREFRNRIAHHEPIFSRNLIADYERLRRLIGWRSPCAVEWLDGIQRISALLSERP